MVASFGSQFNFGKVLSIYRLQRSFALSACDAIRAELKSVRTRIDAVE
jgi:hypothetical protein